jgi:tellurite resistance protein
LYTVLGPAWVNKLEGLRDRLERLGQRPSMQFPSATPAVIEAIGVLETFGPACEAMYLMMAADGKVLNVEREVARGALEIVGEGRVRSAHMEAMLDAAARASAVQGTEKRLAAVVEALRGDAVMAELVAVLCAAVAVADREVKPVEQALFERLTSGLGIGEARLSELVQQFQEKATAPSDDD